MKILLLAPHPFYQERGTPIAVDLLAGVLAGRGDKIDILTYHEGESRSYEGSVQVHRICPRFPINNVRPGFSLKKLACDAHMMPQAIAMAKHNNYDVIHAVEESVFMAMHIRRRFGTPYIFDMDSSMPAQMSESHVIMKPMLPLLKKLENAAIRNAVAVLPMCEALAEEARKAGAQTVRVLTDIPLTERPGAETEAADDLPRGSVNFLYLGNLEPYQGAEHMLRSFALLKRNLPEARLVVAGGNPGHIDKYSKMADELGIGDHAHFIGPRPTRMMKSLFDQSDILLSPRLTGTNTPMKIYSYMASGKPIVATDLPTHRQALDENTAILVAPKPDTFAEGMRKMADNADLREQIGQKAEAKALQNYGYEAFRKTVTELYDKITLHC